MTLLAAALISSWALAQNAEKPKADERPQIYVVDDVGVGDHFPSHVPGTAPYRLPPKDDAPPPAPPPAPPAPPAQEKPASDPAEWAAPPQAVAAQTPAVPVEAKAVAVAAPSPARELETDTIERASNALLQGSCEGELPQLAELIDRSSSADTKARARILRARCYNQRAKPQQAKAEYLLYLQEFPTGRWVAEARETVAER